MDLYGFINDLYRERRRIDRLIQRLERQQRALPPHNPHNRGRKKGMSDQERQQISVRMKAYWTQRRQQPSSHA
jgi:hypothetical protein